MHYWLLWAAIGALATWNLAIIITVGKTNYDLLKTREAVYMTAQNLSDLLSVITKTMEGHINEMPSLRKN